MVTRVRHINPIQFALITAIIYAIIGLIFAILWLPFASMMAATMPHANGGMIGASMGIAGIVIFPLLYFAIMFIFGLLTAWIYNLVAGFTGGFEVTLEQTVAGVPSSNAI
jgi:hypothetical protein